MLTDVQRHRADGGDIQVLLVATDSVEEAVRTMRPLGIAHHGEVTDVCFREGRMEVVHEFTKRSPRRAFGWAFRPTSPRSSNTWKKKAGTWITTWHAPTTEREPRTSSARCLESSPSLPAEVYLEQDPDRMFKVVRKTAKTCLVFKILAAGRLANSPDAVDEVFRHAFASIKPEDCVIVGMFPLYKDEVKETRIVSAASSGA